MTAKLAMIVRRAIWALLLCSGALAWPIQAAQIRSGELVGAKDQGFQPASRADIERILKKLPGTFSVQSYLKQGDIHWLRHAGDLTLHGSLANTHALIVEGNLTIDGNYDDYTGDVGMLVVLGNLQVNNLTSWGSLAVTGRLTASGLVYAYYNDFTIDAGSVKAGALLIYDKSGYIGKTDTGLYMRSDDRANRGPAGRQFSLLAPELMLSALGDDDSDEEDLADLYPDFKAAQTLLRKDEPLLRSRPGPANLLPELARALAPRTGDTALTALIGHDPLLAAAVARRAPLSAALQAKLVALRDRLVWTTLAQNEAVSAHTLTQIAQAAPELAPVVANNAKAPASLLTQSLQGNKPEARRALAQRASLPPDAMQQLAKDSDAEVRVQLIEHHASALAAAQIDALTHDSAAAVRGALIQYAGSQLTAPQLTVLAKDSEQAVRLGVARTLGEVTTLTRLSTLTPEQIEALARQLYADKDEQVRLQALISLPAAEQEKRLAELAPKARQKARARLAESTRSEALQLAIVQEDPIDTKRDLAKNLSISPKAQLALIQLAPPPAKLPPRSAMTLETAAKSLFTFEGVLTELVSNPNATAPVLEAAARYCGEAQDKATTVCTDLMHRHDLSASALETLRSTLKGEAQSDLALTILLSTAATRQQVEWAVPLWHRGNSEQREFKPIAAKSAEADFWNALANARSDELRGVAACNTHTPAATLVRLLKDPSSEVMANAYANPALPGTALRAAPRQRLAYTLDNPAITAERLREILASPGPRDDDTSHKALEKLRLLHLKYPAH